MKANGKSRIGGISRFFTRRSFWLAALPAPGDTWSSRPSGPTRSSPVRVFVPRDSS